MSNLSSKQMLAFIVEMSDVANKITQINILDDSDCQSFYFLSGKSKTYKDIVESCSKSTSSKSRELACVIENLYSVLMSICTSKLAEVRRYLQRTQV